MDRPIPKPSPPTVALFHQVLPEDARVERKQMFGMPCAFVGGNMFFGTFGDSLVARLGPEASAARSAEPGWRIFEPMPGRPWKEYAQVLLSEVSEEELRLSAQAALDWTAALEPKEKKPARPRPRKA
jgi:hypothetical protein